MPGAADTKKILCDAAVATIASHCTMLCVEGRLTDEQRDALIRADERWLKAVRRVLGDELVDRLVGK